MLYRPRAYSKDDIFVNIFSQGTDCIFVGKKLIYPPITVDPMTLFFEAKTNRGMSRVLMKSDRCHLYELAPFLKCQYDRQSHQLAHAPVRRLSGRTLATRESLIKQ